MIRNKQKNKGPAPYRRHRSSDSGFVMLFAVTIASILLSIALGVAQVALKELKFSTSARDTNNAFFAADTGIEAALFRDKPPSNYPPPETDGAEQTYPEIFPNLSGPNGSCAIVKITKTNVLDSSDIETAVVSKGYNVGDASCASTNTNRIERELKLNY